MRNKSVISEARDIRLAVELIELGARRQMLEVETNLSRERLLKLYKEVRGESPPKGMLPFSTDWFMTWQPNIHASIQQAIHQPVPVVGRLHRQTPDPLPKRLQRFADRLQIIRQPTLEHRSVLTVHHRAEDACLRRTATCSSKDSGLRASRRSGRTCPILGIR